MKKIAAIVLSGTAVLLLSACGGGGGGGSSTPTQPSAPTEPSAPVDPMTERGSIYIKYNIAENECPSAGYVTPSGVTYEIHRLETNDISCADYGRVAAASRTDGSTGCSQEDMHQLAPSLWPVTGIACVWGFDVSTSAKTEDILLQATDISLQSI